MMLSKHSKYASNAIEESNKFAQSLADSGKNVVWLNRGDPAKFFPTPKYVIDAYVKALRAGKTYYSDPTGVPELRETVAQRYNEMAKLSLTSENVIITQGISEGLQILNEALMDPGDHAAIMSPYFSPYVSYLKLSGGIAIFGNYDEEQGWKIDTDGLRRKLKKDRKRIKYMLFANPNNPTGTTIGKRELSELVDIANEHEALIVSDEIYDEIIYNGVKFISMASVAKGVPHMILHGASKVFDGTGFRIGFMIVPEVDKMSLEVRNKMCDLVSMRLSANTPAQYAVNEAISNKSEHQRAIRSMVRSIKDRCNHAASLINESDLMSVVPPNGAFYLLPRVDFKRTKFKNDAQFVSELLKTEYIYVTRGTGFGAKSHIRIVALPPKDILEYAIDRISGLLKENCK